MSEDLEVCFAKQQHFLNVWNGHLASFTLLQQAIQCVLYSDLIHESDQVLLFVRPPAPFISTGHGVQDIKEAEGAYVHHNVTTS